MIESVKEGNRLQRHLGLKSGHPLLLLRIGYSGPMPGSYRRPVEDVLIKQSGEAEEERHREAAGSES